MNANKNIASGKATLGAATIDVVQKIEASPLFEGPKNSLTVLPALLYVAMNLQNEPDYYHQDLEMVGKNVADHAIAFNGDPAVILGGKLGEKINPRLVAATMSLAGETMLIKSAFDEVPLPSGMGFDNAEITIPNEIGRLLANRPNEIIPLVALLISETLYFRDGKSALSQNILSKGDASRYIQILSDPSLSTDAYRLTTLLAAYSLVTGSQTSLPFSIVPAVNKMANQQLSLPDFVVQKEFGSTLEQLNVTMSGHGRIKHWLTDEVLRAIVKRSKLQPINILHFGGGVTEPVDMRVRIAALNGVLGSSTNLDILDPKELNSSQTYMQFDNSGPVDNSNTPIDASTIGFHEYAFIRDMFTDLREGKRFPTLEGKFQLVISLHAIKPHLKSTQMYVALKNAVQALDRNGGTLFVGGWYGGKPVGCNGICLTTENNSIRVNYVVMASVTNEDGIITGNTTHFTRNQFNELQNWNPPRHSESVKI